MALRWNVHRVWCLSNYILNSWLGLASEVCLSLRLKMIVPNTDILHRHRTFRPTHISSIMIRWCISRTGVCNFGLVELPLSLSYLLFAETWLKHVMLFPLGKTCTLHFLFFTVTVIKVTAFCVFFSLCLASTQEGSWFYPNLKLITLKRKGLLQNHWVLLDCSLWTWE